MVLARTKFINLSKEELIEELLSFHDLYEKIIDLTKKMDDFPAKFDRAKYTNNKLPISADWFTFS